MIRLSKPPQLQPMREQAHAVQHRVDARLRDRLQHDAEEPRTRHEIALPQLVAARPGSAG